MQGIDELTNIMQAGGRSDVPMNMGPQPMEAPQGIAGMMPPQDMAMMQQEQVPNPADSAPQGIDINSDADMLASAVVGRTNGDLDEAEQVLEQSLMLIQNAKAQSTQQPMMAAYGKPIRAAEGRAMSATDFEKFYNTINSDNSGQPSFNWRDLFYKETPDLRNVLRAIITDSLKNQKGRAMSDKDIGSGRSLSDKDLDLLQTISGRTMSDRDLETISGRTMSDQDVKKGLERMKPSNKLADGGVIYLP